MKNMKSGSQKVLRWRREEVEASLNERGETKLKWLKRRGRFLVQTRENMSIKEELWATEKAEQGLLFDKSSPRVLFRLFTKEMHGSFRSCVREWDCAKGEGILDGYILVKFVKIEYIKESFCFSLEAYDGHEEMMRTGDTKCCISHEQKVYVS